MEPHVAIVVGSCDRYAPCWPFVEHGLLRYWPDCPWPAILISSNRMPPPYFQSLQVLPDRGWGATTFIALSQLQDDYSVVLYVMEDTWLSDEPDVGTLIRYANLLLNDQADHIQLCPTWGDCGGIVSKWKYPCPMDQSLMVFANDSAYRTSLQPGLWRVDVMLRLLKPGDTPWSFEIEGSRRITDPDRFLCVREFGCLPFATGNDPSRKWSREPVRGGKWTATAREYVQVEKLPRTWLEGMEWLTTP